MYSFEIGSNFEEYFEKNIPKNFEILLKAPPKSNDFDFENLRPDFKLKHKPTGVEFYVECKYHSYIEELRNYNSFSLEKTNMKQIHRYKKNFNNIPILYLIGVGILDKKNSLKIKELYLININKMYHELYLSYVLNFQIKSMNDFETAFKQQFFL